MSTQTLEDRASALETAFETAGIPAFVSRKPLSALTSQPVFAMTIANRRRQTERVSVFPGKSARVTVLDANPTEQQILVRVKEGVGTFLVKERTSRDSVSTGSRLHGGTVVSVGNINRNNLYSGRQVVIRRTTPKSERTYLIGADEDNLFIAQVPNGPRTVSGAHAALKPDAAKVAGTIRQGEWFFVPTNEKLRDNIDAVWKNARGPGTGNFDGSFYTVSAKPGSFRRTTNPHTASQRVNLDGNVYVRGTIRCRTHPMLFLPTWRRVVRNLEIPLPQHARFVD